MVLHMNVQRTDATKHKADLAANMPQKGKSKTGIECRVKEEKHRKYPTLNSQKIPHIDEINVNSQKSAG